MSDPTAAPSQVFNPFAPRGRQVRGLVFAIALPIVWGMVLLALALAELRFDPYNVNGVGETLDRVSIYLWYSGAILIPLAAGIYCRARDFSTWSSLALAVFSLLAFGVVSIADLAIYFALDPVSLLDD